MHSMDIIVYYTNYIHGGENACIAALPVPCAKATAVWSRSARWVAQSLVFFVDREGQFLSSWSDILVPVGSTPTLLSERVYHFVESLHPSDSNMSLPQPFSRDQLEYLRRIFPDTELPEPSETPEPTPAAVPFDPTSTSTSTLTTGTWDWCIGT